MGAQSTTFLTRADAEHRYVEKMSPRLLKEARALDDDELERAIETEIDNYSIVETEEEARKLNGRW